MRFFRAGAPSIRRLKFLEVLDGLALGRDQPEGLRVDEGPEVAGRMLDQWAYMNEMELDFSRLT